MTCIYNSRILKLTFSNGRDMILEENGLLLLLEDLAKLICHKKETRGEMR